MTEANVFSFQFSVFEIKGIMERKDSCEELIDGPLVTSASQDLKRCLSAIPHQIPVLRVLFILERDETFWNYYTEVIHFFLRHTNETALFNNLLWFLRLKIQFQCFLHILQH